MTAPAVPISKYNGDSWYADITFKYQSKTTLSLDFGINAQFGETYLWAALPTIQYQASLTISTQAVRVVGLWQNPSAFTGIDVGVAAQWAIAAAGVFSDIAANGSNGAFLSKTASDLRLNDTTKTALKQNDGIVYQHKGQASMLSITSVVWG